MQQEDPRNIFFSQRQQYSEQNSDQNTQAPKQCGTRQGDSNRNFQDSGQSVGSNSGTQQTYEEKVAEMKRLAAKYQREGEGQLVKDIVNSVIEQKAAGKLSNDQLTAFAKRITPLLNAEQRTRLNALVEQLLKL